MKGLTGNGLRWTILGPVLLLAGCSDDSDDSRPFCPSCWDIVTWNSYGSFVFDASGRDSTARRIVSECGWSVHGGHNGGIGDTLQVSSCPDDPCPALAPAATLIDTTISDSCEDPVFIVAFPFLGIGDTSGATVDATDPSVICGAGGSQAHTVWYALTAPEDGHLFADTVGSDYDTVLSVHSGDCGSWKTLVCNDDAVGLQSRVQLEVSAGFDYFIEVGSYGGGPGGELELNVDFATCLPGDDGVVLVWAFNSLSAVRLGPGWGGSTVEGIRIGEPRHEFVKTYPEFYPIDSDTLEYRSGGILVTATFDESSRLVELIVGHYFRR